MIQNFDNYQLHVYNKLHVYNILPSLIASSNLVQALQIYYSHGPVIVCIETVCNFLFITLYSLCLLLSLPLMVVHLLFKQVVLVTPIILLTSPDVRHALITLSLCQAAPPLATASVPWDTSECQMAREENACVSFLKQ